MSDDYENQPVAISMQPGPQEQNKAMRLLREDFEENYLNYPPEGRFNFHLAHDPKTGTYWLKSEQGGVITNIQKFLEAVRLKGLSPRTIRSYAFDLLSFLRWFDRSGVPMTEMTQGHLFSWISEQRAAERKPRTINRRLGTALMFYEFIVGNPMPKGKGLFSGTSPLFRTGYDQNLGIYRNSISRKNLVKVRLPQDLVIPLEEREICEMFRSFRRYRDLAIVSLMFFCGLRSAEVRNVRLRSLQYLDRTIRIIGKGNRERILPLPAFIRRVVDRYVDLERPEDCPTDHLFVVLQGPNRGNPLTEEGFRTLFRYRRNRLSIPRANPHRFRHSFGASLAKNGVSLTTIRRLLGHSDVRTTMRYVNLSVEDIRIEYEKAVEVLRKRYVGMGL